MDTSTLTRQTLPDASQDAYRAPFPAESAAWVLTAEADRRSEETERAAEFAAYFPGIAY